MSLSLAAPSSRDFAAIVRKGVARITKSRFWAPSARETASRRAFENDSSPFHALPGARSGPKFCFFDFQSTFDIGAISRAISHSFPPPLTPVFAGGAIWGAENVGGGQGLSKTVPNSLPFAKLERERARGYLQRDTRVREREAFGRTNGVCKAHRQLPAKSWRYWGMWAGLASRGGLARLPARSTQTALAA